MSEPSLDQVLSGEEPEPEVVSEEIKETEGEGKGEISEPPSDEDKAEKEPEKEPDKEPEKDSDRDKAVPITALLDERDKRQRAERELEQLKSQQKPEEPKDPLQDPEGWQEQQARQANQQRFEDALELMTELKPETAEAWQWAQEETQDNAVLLAKFAEHQGKPVALLRAVVRAYEQHQKVSQLEDVDAIEARIRAEVEARIRGEMEAEKEGTAEKAKEVEKAVTKPSVVSEGTSTSTGYQGEMTLEDVVGLDALSRPK